MDAALPRETGTKNREAEKVGLLWKAVLLQPRKFTLSLLVKSSRRFEVGI